MKNTFFTKCLYMLLILVLVFLIGDSAYASSEREATISEQIEFRNEFGLESEKLQVELLNKEGKFSDKSKFQVPLTAAEESELEERFIKQNEEVPKVKKFLEGKHLSEDYSIYIDQTKKGEIVVKVRKFKGEKLSNEKKQSLLNELSNVSSTVEYRIEDSNYSEEDLNKISEEIWEKKDSLNLEIDSTSVDIINEKVTIGIIDYTSEKATKIFSAFEGHPLEVIQVSPPSDFRSAYGGEKLVNSRSRGCSAGYYATSGSNHYLITAGHCSRTYDEPTGKIVFYHSDTYKYGATYLGKVNRIRFGGNLDALTISVSSSHANSTVNINGGLRKMTSSQARNGDTVGQAVCRVGYASATYDCGTLRSKNVGYSIAGATFSGLRGTNLSTIGGDSGGTVYNSFQYIGVTKGIGGGYSHVYTQIGNINYDLGLATYLK